MFVAKYNTSGTPIWSTKVEFSNSINGNTAGFSIVIDQSDNIYTVGTYTPQSSVPGPVNIYSAGNQTTPARVVYGWPVPGGTAIILVKYNSNGIVQWATNIRPPDGEAAQGALIPYGLTVSGGYIYIVGQARVSNLATYDPTNATTNPATGTQTQTGNTMIYDNGGINPPNTSNGILVVYNTNGIPQWKTHFVGTNSSNFGVIVTSVVTGDGNVYVSGYFNSLLLTFYNTPDGTVNSNFTLTNTGINNNFTVVYNTEGKVLRARNLNLPGTYSNWGPSMAFTNALYATSSSYLQ
jgi:hypothetical protein